MVARGYVRLETITRRSARRLGIEAETVRSPGRRKGRLHADVVKVEDLWAEVQLDDHWLAAYRFVVTTDGRLQIGELRIIPRDSASSRDQPPGTWTGTWKGIYADAPLTPLRSRHVHALRVALHAEQLDEIFRQLRGDRRIAQSTLTRWGLGRGEPAAEHVASTTVRRGRRPIYSAVFYAKIARDYCDAVHRGDRAIRAIASNRKVSPAQARGFVARARKSGMLRDPHQGQQGGRLTDKARQLLRSHTPKRTRSKPTPS